jgi:hypothetical protein
LIGYSNFILTKMSSAMWCSLFEVQIVKKLKAQKLFRKPIHCQRFHQPPNHLEVDADGCPSSSETSQ